MNIQVISIAARGNRNIEQVQLSVIKDTNLSFYVALLTDHIEANSVRNGNLRAYWFPPQAVRAGDQVILLTCPGTNTSRQQANGSTTYFCYWGLPETVLTNPTSSVVLIEASTWAASS